MGTENGEKVSDDLISRQAAIDATWFEPSYTDPLNVLTEVRDRLKVLPSSQPERKRGKWKVCSILDYKQRPTGRNVGLCPFCEFLTGEFRTLFEGNRELTKFCPNCGAQMEN